MRVEDGPKGGNVPASISSLPAREVTALAFDEEETLWIGTRCGGIFTYREGALSYHYDAFNTGALPDSGIRSITIDTRGRKWFVSRRGFVYLLDPARGWRVWGDVGYARTTPGAQSLIAPLDTDPPEFWFVTQDGRLAHVRDDTVLAIVAPEPSLGAITALTFDYTNARRLWVATENAGPAWWDGQELVPAASDIFDGHHTRDLVAHKSGRKMIAATSKGLWVLENGWNEIPILDRTQGAAPRFGTDLAWVRIRDDWLIVGHEAEFAISVGDTSSLIRDRFGLPILDGALDGRGSPWVGSGVGVRRLEMQEALVWTLPVPADVEPLPDWQNRNLERLINETSRPVLLDDLLYQPRSYLGRKVTIRGGKITVSRGDAPVHRLVDEVGNARSVRLKPHSSWIGFQATRGEPPLDRDTRELFDFSGYIEFGGCYGTQELGDPWYQFFVVEHYPATMPVELRQAQRADIQRYCETNSCSQRPQTR